MVYQSSAQKAQDNHASGIMLITVGAIGLVGDIFFLANDPMDMPLFNRYLTCGVMGALFVLFFVMGILSVRTYKIFSVKAKEERSVLDNVKEWCSRELTTDVVDSHMYDADEAEEVEFLVDYDESSESDEGDKYFRRSGYIKKRIMNQFINIDEGLIDTLVEELMNEMYGEEN